MSQETAEWPRGVRADRVLVMVPGDQAWRLSRVTRQGRGLRVEPAGSVPFAADAAGAVPATRSGDAWVVMGLPAQDVVARRLETPFSDANKARQVLPSLLDGHLPFALEKCLHAFVEPRRNAAGHQTALAVAARREEVDSLLDACAASGLEPAVIDAEGLALWRQALREIPAAAGEKGRVLAHAGDGRITLVLGRGAEWQDTLAFRTNAASSGAGEEERVDLIRRVQRRWRSLPPEWSGADIRWIWCGPDADEALLRALAPRVAPEGSEAPRLAPAPTTFLERALAAPLVLDGAPALNLLPATRAPAALRRAGTAGERRSALAWIAAALLPALVAFSWQTRVRARADSFRAQALAAYEELAGAPCPQPELVHLLAPRALEERKAGLKPFLQAAEPPRSQTLRAVLHAVHEKGLHAEKLEWSGPTLRLHGPVVAGNDAESLALTLGGAGLVAAPEPGPPGHWQVKVEVAP